MERENSHHIDYSIIGADWKTLTTLARQGVISSKLYKTCLNKNICPCTGLISSIMRTVQSLWECISLKEFLGAYFVAVACLANGFLKTA